MLSLEIQKKFSMLNNLKLYEKVDLQEFDELIKSPQLINDIRNNSIEFKNDYYSDIFQHLAEYKKQFKKRKNLFSVEYKKPTWYGRAYPKKGLGLTFFSKKIRNSLIHKTYVDIDIENSSPTILYNLCYNNNIECRNLKNYVENRETHFKELTEYYGKPRSIIKDLFLRLSSLGGYENWKNDNGVELPATEFILNFKNEMKYIALEFKKENGVFYNIILKKKDNDTENAMRSFFSSYIQHKETEIMEHVMDYLINEIEICKNLILTYEFDGLKILKNAVDGYGTVDKLTKDIEKYILTKTGFNLTFVNKPIEAYYKIDVKPADNVDKFDDSYDNVKEEFEKTHFKITNKMLFVKITKEGKNMLLTGSEIFNMYAEKRFSAIDAKTKKMIRPQFMKFWPTDENIKKYIDMGIYPPPLIVPENYYNLWMPFEMEKITEYQEHKEGLDFMLNHINALCGFNEKIYNHFIMWIGQLIKYPHLKTICPSLISDEGAGKGSLVKLIKKMLGSDKVMESSDPARDVWGNFNARMESCYFVVLNELSKRDTNGSMGRIKALVTDDDIIINEKGKSQFSVRSFHRFMITTNVEGGALLTSRGDRRNMIIRSSDIYKGNSSYFIKFNDYVNNVNVVKSCFEYFKNLEGLETFHNLPIPDNEYQEELKELSVSPIERWAEYILCGFIEEELVDEDEEEDVYRMSSKEAYTSFRKWAIANGIMDEAGTKYNLSSIQFCVRLSNLKIEGLTKYRTNTSRGYILTISQMKKHFNIE